MKRTPRKQEIDQGIYKLIDGVWHKRCTGPAHDEVTYLPATDKYFHIRQSAGREGQFMSRCRLCTAWVQVDSPGSHHGWIPAPTVRHFYIEAVNRVGMMELSRRTGLHYGGLERIVTGKTKFVQKAKFRLVMLELISMRRKNEHATHPKARHWTHRRNTRGQELCSGCGVPQHRYTDGCKQCMWRRYQHTGRGTDLDVVGSNSKVA